MATNASTRRPAAAGWEILRGRLPLFAPRLFRSAAQLALLFVAARLLAPSEVGLFVVAIALYRLSGLCAQAGWRDLALQEGSSPAPVSSVITSSIVLGYTIGLLGLIMAYSSGAFFDSPKITLLLLCYSAALALAPLLQTLHGLALRRGAERGHGVAALTGEILGLAAGLAGLYAGWGVVALGLAELVTQVLILAGALFVVRFTFRLTPSGLPARRAFMAVGPEVARNVVKDGASLAPVLIVAPILGLSNAAYIYLAQRSVAFLAEMVFEPLRLFSRVAFQRAALDAISVEEARRRIGEEVKSIAPLMGLFAAPIFALVALLPQELIVVSFGEKLLPAALPLSLFAIAAAFRLPTLLDRPVLQGVGAQRAAQRVAQANAIITIIAFGVLSPFGFAYAAAAGLASAIVTSFISIWMQTRHASAPWLHALKVSAPIYTGVIALTAAVFFASRLLMETDLNEPLQLLIKIAAGFLAYVLTVLIVRPSFLRLIFHLD